MADKAPSTKITTVGNKAGEGAPRDGKASGGSKLYNGEPGMKPKTGGLSEVTYDTSIGNPHNAGK